MSKIYIAEMASLVSFHTNNIKKTRPHAASDNSQKIILKNPDFAGLLPANLSRRTSTIIKRAIYLTNQIVKSNTPEIQAIHIATGGGSQDESTKFLENFAQSLPNAILSPQPFFLSIQNAIAGHIAMFLNLKVPNFTFCQNNLSFESALKYTFFKLQNNLIQSCLFVSIDEFNQENFNIMNAHQFIKNITDINDTFYPSKSPGHIAGEGGEAYILTNQLTQNTIAEILTIEFKYKLTEINIKDFIIKELSKYQLALKDMDLILCGLNSDYLYDNMYDSVVHSPDLDNATILQYKSLCGEYFTAQSTGFYIGLNALQTQMIPEELVIKKSLSPNPKINYVLLCNQFRGAEFSFIVLKSIT